MTNPQELLPCKGCELNSAMPHSADCYFQHFLSYTGFAALPEEEISRLKIAYEHGASPQDAQGEVVERVIDVLDEISSELLTAGTVDGLWEQKLAACSDLLYDLIGRDRSHLSPRKSVNRQREAIILTIPKWRVVTGDEAISNYEDVLNKARESIEKDMETDDPGIPYNFNDKWKKLTLAIAEIPHTRALLTHLNGDKHE